MKSSVHSTRRRAGPSPTHWRNVPPRPDARPASGAIELCPRDRGTSAIRATRRGAARRRSPRAPHRSLPSAGFMPAGFAVQRRAANPRDYRRPARRAAGCCQSPEQIAGRSASRASSGHSPPRRAAPATRTLAHETRGSPFVTARIVQVEGPPCTNTTRRMVSRSAHGLAVERTIAAAMRAIPAATAVAASPAAVTRGAPKDHGEDANRPRAYVIGLSLPLCCVACGSCRARAPCSLPPASPALRCPSCCGDERQFVRDVLVGGSAPASGLLNSLLFTIDLPLNLPIAMPIARLVGARKPAASGGNARQAGALGWRRRRC